MSHFGRSGPPDIKDTYSLLVLNISFRTTADDLFPLFDRYGKVVDVFIPRDRRSGESRGFAFVRNVDGRNIMVQFAKYGPNAERIHKGRIVEVIPKTRGKSRSRSPRPRYRDSYRDRDYRRRSRSRSRGRYESDRYNDRERDYHHRSRSASPDYSRGRGRDDRRSRSVSYDSASPARHSRSPERSPTPRRTPPSSPEKGSHGERSPPSKSASPLARRAGLTCCLCIGGCVLPLLSNFGFGGLLLSYLFVKSADVAFDEMISEGCFLADDVLADDLCSSLLMLMVMMNVDGDVDGDDEC
ncbi:RNA recognition motif containing protein [Musa troglodytarum]|uniref:RNA recognition motif containing protein n=1 Tax=Musa troglodytarum TaxID=320322 RepID=A0A9E7F2I1_9LILI|nr:RNA recognition motif containing protein [Musa troglodytarum]